ncbi:MAG: Na/Pi cotransporter family protein, partial [bacterium]
PLIITVGFILYAFSQKKTRQAAGQLLLGIGIIFFSMKMMSVSASPLRNSKFFSQIMLSSGPLGLKAILVAAAFTAVIQSSAATIALLISFSITPCGSAPPLISDIKDAIPFILGANIGTCSTALVASISSEIQAKRVAWAHIIFKIFGVLLVIPFISPLSKLAALTSDNITNQIANAHTAFNVIVSLVFLPFLTPYTNILTKLFTAGKRNKDSLKHLFIKDTYKELPILALGQTNKEIMRMSEIVIEMLEKTWPIIINHDQNQLDKVLSYDDRVDKLHAYITPYLLHMDREGLPEDLEHKHFQLLMTNTLVEQIGDIISKNLMHLAEKIIKMNLNFSDEGIKEIKDYLDKVTLEFKKIVNAVGLNNIALAQEVVARHKTLNSLYTSLQTSHFARLKKGIKESLETTAIHMDFIEYLKRINESTVNIGKTMIKYNK